MSDLFYNARFAFEASSKIQLRVSSTAAVCTCISSSNQSREQEHLGSAFQAQLRKHATSIEAQSEVNVVKQFIGDLNIYTASGKRWIIHSYGILANHCSLFSVMQLYRYLDHIYDIQVSPIVQYNTSVLASVETLSYWPFQRMYCTAFLLLTSNCESCI